MRTRGKATSIRTRERGPKDRRKWIRKLVPSGAEGGLYNPLQKKDLQKIHEASLHVLEATGIEIQPSECRDIFQDAGARIDANNNRVFLPRSMVEDGLATAPQKVYLFGRDERHEMELGGSKVYMGTGGAALKVVDLETRGVRETTLADVARIGRLVDGLSNIHFYLRPCVAQDIPLHLLDINTYYAGLANTSKHVTGNCYSVQSLLEVIELASLIAGGRAGLREKPLISVVNSWMVSPLRFAPDTVMVLTEAVRQEIPVFLSSAPMTGATSPAPLAGTLVQINAEELAGLVYTQLVKPGAPVILGYVPSVMDLRTGVFIGGSAEFALMHAAAAQLGQFYNLPVYNSSGLTESKLSDTQAGYEKAMTGMAAALAGANYIHHSAGFFESMLTIAYAQYVIDDDINGAIMRMVRGIEVNDDTLSLDVIDQVCRDGKNYFLANKQSLRAASTEFYYPHTADRQSRDVWEKGGRLSMWDRACIKAKHILDTHVAKPIPTEIDKEIRRRFDILLPPDLASIQ